MKIDAKQGRTFIKHRKNGSLSRVTREDFSSIVIHTGKPRTAERVCNVVGAELSKLGGRTAKVRAKRAIANVALESMKPSKEAVACVHNMAEGKITASEAVQMITKIHAR